MTKILLHLRQLIACGITKISENKIASGAILMDIAR
jgi:hypothetical protein